MTAGAWIFLAVTWGVVTGVAGYLFWKVVRTPSKRE